MSFDYDLKAMASTYDTRHFDRETAYRSPWWIGDSDFSRAQLRFELEQAEARAGEHRTGILAQRIDRLPGLELVERALLRAHIRPGSARERALLLGWIRGERWAEAVAHYSPQSNPFREAMQVALDAVMARGFAIVHGTATKQGPGLFLCHNRINAAVPRWGCTWCNEAEQYESSPDPDPCPGCGGLGWIGETGAERRKRERARDREVAQRRGVQKAGLAALRALGADFANGPSRTAIVRSVDGTIARVHRISGDDVVRAHRPAPGSLEYDADETVEPEP